MLDALAPESEQYYIHTCDAVAGKPTILTSQTSLRKDHTLMAFMVS